MKATILENEEIYLYPEITKYSFHVHQVHNVNQDIL